MSLPSLSKAFLKTQTYVAINDYKDYLYAYTYSYSALTHNMWKFNEVTYNERFRHIIIYENSQKTH